MSRLVVRIYGLIYRLHKAGLPWVPAVLNKVLVRLLFGCQIGLGAELGPGVELGYGGLGVVIHARCVVGARTRIGANVTLGGVAGGGRVPVVGADCVISTGAKVLGPIHIGEGSVIGANAVVLKDVPPRSVVVGVPARVVKSEIDVDNYR